MKRLNGAGTRALDTIKGFTLAQRTIAIIGVAVLALGGIALSSWLGQPTYQVLYSNLSAANASSVVAQLDKDKVQYQLSDGGNTILVPAAAVDSERLATASMLSSGAGGYSLLDNMGVTASEFQQNVTYKRAIEGELAKTIESITGVTAASVQLAIPQQSVFSDNTEKPTASVFVNVSSDLTSDQVNAIVHLVAAAYPGLTTDNVSVVDQKGDTLSSVGGGAGGSSSDAAADYETTTKDAVQSMLDKVLGPGNAVVTVAADVSNSTGTKQSESYSTPTQAPVLSESNNDTLYSGTGATSAASGVLGVDTTNTSTSSANGTTNPLTGATTSSGTGTSPTYTQKQGTKNNAVDKTVTSQTITPGTLNRQTIAVALNSSVGSAISNTALQQMVSNAAGVNLARGDSVSVTSVAFSGAAAKAAATALKQSQAAESAGQTTELITTAIKVVGGILIVLLAFVLLKKLFKRQDPIIRDAGTMNIIPVPVAGDGAALLGTSAGQLDGAAPTAVLTMPQGMGGAGALRAPADASFARMQADVDALAGTDPEQTAEYLRALMGDRVGV